MKRATLRVLVTLVVLSAGAGAVLAQSPGWKYVEGGLWNVNPDRGSSEDGWFLGGSWELGKETRFHVFAEAGDLDSNTQWSVGGGWHGLLGERADIVAEGAFVDADEVDGFRVAGGVRWMLLRRLELNGWVNYVDLDSTDQTSFEVGAIFDLTKRFGVGGSYDWGDDFDTTRVFVRFNFGARS
jgi:hypothetical protein